MGISRHREDYLRSILREKMQPKEKTIINEVWSSLILDKEEVMVQSYPDLSFSLDGCVLWLSPRFREEGMWYDRSGCGNVCLHNNILSTPALSTDQLTFFVKFDPSHFTQEHTTICAKVRDNSFQQGWSLRKRADILEFTVDTKKMQWPFPVSPSFFQGGYNKKYVIGQLNGVIGSPVPYGAGIMKSNEKMFVSPSIEELLYFNITIKEEDQQLILAYLA